MIDQSGAIAGKLRDTGIKSDTLKEMGEELSPGDYAVVTELFEMLRPA